MLRREGREEQSLGGGGGGEELHFLTESKRTVSLRGHEGPNRDCIQNNSISLLMKKKPSVSLSSQLRMNQPCPMSVSIADSQLVVDAPKVNIDFLLSLRYYSIDFSPFFLFFFPVYRIQCLRFIHLVLLVWVQHTNPYEFQFCTNLLRISQEKHVDLSPFFQIGSTVQVKFDLIGGNVDSQCNTFYSLVNTT